jgi:RNA polymerase-associated protein CTR9
MSAPTTFQIPIRNSNEFVELRADELPNDASLLLGILKGEQAPLSLWMQFAIEYYRRGQVSSFLAILNEATTEPSIGELYPNSQKERIAMLNSLAAHHAGLAVQEKDATEKERLFTAATQLLNKADPIDVVHELTMFGKGSVMLAKGEIAKADQFFGLALQS